MAKSKRYPLGTFIKEFSNEAKCREYLANLRWPGGFVCPKCGCRHACLLSNGRYQCAGCRRQSSVTSGTVLHKTHMPLTQWFLAFYFVSQDKRGISAAALMSMLGTTYKTAWYMLTRIRAAMGQRDKTHQLSGTIEFDDTYFGGPTVGKKRGRGTEKAKVFAAVSLDERGNPRHIKMQLTQDIKRASVKKFAQAAFAPGSIIHSDGYRSYIPALGSYTHEHKPYDPNSGLLHWLHIAISNAKAFILGTYHGLPEKNLQSYLDEYCFRFSRRDFGPRLLERLALAVGLSVRLS
mgnify:CR=1 FL=1